MVDVAQELRPIPGETQDMFFKRVMDDEELKKRHPGKSQRYIYAHQWWRMGPKRSIYDY